MQSDAEFYELGQEFPIAFVLLGQGTRPRGAYEGTSLTVKRVERRIDLVLWPQDDADDVWIVECHGTPDPLAERNLLLKAVLLAARNDLWGRVRTLVVYLSAGAARAALPPSLGRDRPGTFRPVRVVLGEMSPEALLRLGPELFPLLPLSKVGRETIRGGVRAWWECIARAPGISRALRGELWNRFVTFLLARFDRDTLRQVTKIIEGEVMSIEKTRAGQDLIAIGERRGERRGRRKGERKGERKGRRQGLVESILQAIEIRFGRIPEDLPPILDGIEDLDSLREVHRLALSIRDLRSLRRRLGAR